MTDLLAGPWPWYVAGPLIGLVVPIALLLGNRSFGFSSNLRHLCASSLPAPGAFFRYDWRDSGAWNLAFMAGTFGGAFVAGRFIGLDEVPLGPETRAALAAAGVQAFEGLVPADVFSWASLLTPAGFIIIVVGGFLIGFGTAWAGGCTSGHGVTGLADLQLPSLVAVMGFFAGGLAATHWLLPWLLGG
jgi:uncharacterized protein